MVRTLLTGFGPFGGVTSNPTQRLVELFGQTGAEGHLLTCCVLPVSYERAPAAMTEALSAGASDGAPFDLIWMLGVAARETRWRVEKFGRNRNGRKADADGACLPRVIEPDAPSLLESTVPVLRVRQALTAAGIPARVSLSAGSYLCNYILFRALRDVSKAGLSARSGFLHVPPDSETASPESAAGPVFPFDLHVRALTTTLAELARTV